MLFWLILSQVKALPVRILPGPKLAKHPASVTTCPSLERPHPVPSRVRLQFSKATRETQLQAQSR